MTENSRDGKVLQIAHKQDTTGSKEHPCGSVYSEALKQKDPCKYYFLEAKRAEINLDFDKAIKCYTHGYDEALKQHLSCALKFKWEAMRCVEFDSIHKELMREWESNGKNSRRIGNNTLCHWYDEGDVIPEKILKAAKSKIPVGYIYNLVMWNRATETVRFIHSAGFYTESEPTLDREWTVFGGTLSAVLNHHNFNPEVLFDKWMYSEGRNTFDQKAAIRRSIRIRYLKIPMPLQLKMNHYDIWYKYVVPAIGNRSLGELYDKFLKEEKL